MRSFIPKIVGIETEYGIALRSCSASLQVTQDFFLQSVGEGIPLSRKAESPSKDARHILPYQRGGRAVASRSERSSRVQMDEEVSGEDALGVDDEVPSIVLSLDRILSTFLSNGARFYIDHAHPEYSTPECLTARELVVHDKAGERLLMRMARQFNEGRRPADQIVLYKNNSDHQGHSYGCHENYLMDAAAYEGLFNNKAHWLYLYLLPYLVTRQVFCGAGKVGLERESGVVDYQISQRADFFSRVIGLQTMHNRPIINTRDEPHADSSRFRRLHVICGDANLAEWSTYLKVGVTQLILAMIEAGGLDLEEDVTLADPVAAIKTISRNPDLDALVELEHGHRQRNAVQIQRSFVEAARRYLDRDSVAREAWDQVWTDWAWVIDTLETDPEALDRYLDWRVKWKFLRQQIDRKGGSWQDPVARELDVRYHQLDTDDGFFFLLRDTGQIEGLVTGEEIEEATVAPPMTTRAYLRGYLIDHYADELLSANWDVLDFLSRSGVEGSTLNRMHLSDPISSTRPRTGASLEHVSEDIAAEMDELIDLLEQEQGKHRGEE